MGIIPYFPPSPSLTHKWNIADGRIAKLLFPLPWKEGWFSCIWSMASFPLKTFTLPSQQIKKTKMQEKAFWIKAKLKFYPRADAHKVSSNRFITKLKFIKKILNNISKTWQVSSFFPTCFQIYVLVKNSSNSMDYQSVLHVQFRYELKVVFNVHPGE